MQWARKIQSPAAQRKVVIKVAVGLWVEVKWVSVGAGMVKIMLKFCPRS